MPLFGVLRVCVPDPCLPRARDVLLAAELGTGVIAHVDSREGLDGLEFPA